MNCLFPPLADETRYILESLPAIIDKAFPIPARFRSELPRDVAKLSRLLTCEREDRSGSYLGIDSLLSAYLRYFLPWNIYRLTRLFTSLPLKLKPHDSVNDLGSGPLTLAASLWISRPDLRGIPLEFRCLDKTAAVLETGKKFFAALTAAFPNNKGESASFGKSGEKEGTACPWTIRTIRGEIKKNGKLSSEIRGDGAALSAAVNVYNELFWDFSPADSGQAALFAEKQARLLSSLTAGTGSIFVAEPGIPRSGEFISLLRSAFIKEGRSPVSPCTHQGPCPLPGGRPGNHPSHRTGSHHSGVKAKWCHFAFDTENAPAALHKLSAAAHIPKERAVMSFILAGPAGQSRDKAPKGHTEAGTDSPVSIRIISDCFPINAAKGSSTGRLGRKTGENYERKNRDQAGYKETIVSWGRYGCSEQGLVLITGSRECLAFSSSGKAEYLPINKGNIDEKSGALIAHKKEP